VVTILDSNITTMIAGLVLLEFGTGPVRGFAVTLMIGLVSNVLTAVFMARIVFDYLYAYKRWKTISI
jgi:preprotein translocase subunit SecD